MNLSDSLASIDSVKVFLASIRERGLRLWSIDGQLHYKAPKGALTYEEFERLRESKIQIVELLERANDVETAEPRLEPSVRLDRAPLAFSQLAHWNQYRLGERRAIRQVMTATRLRGRLNIDVLRASIDEIIRRHGALRTRIIVIDGVPTQEISQSCTADFKVQDLTRTPVELREAEVVRIIEQTELESINVAADPLFTIRLLKLRSVEYVLIVALEHMISDALSMKIILRDLFTVYSQTLKGQVVSLPEIPIQFADYAVWQRSTHGSWRKQHGEYVNGLLIEPQRLRFPEDQGAHATNRGGWAIAPIQMGRNLKMDLQEWCRVRRTTLALSVFTAYVGLVLRWCDASESVIQFQSDGRFRPEIENAVGYFSSVLYVHAKLLNDESFVDLMQRLTKEYCIAYEHADFSYIAAQLPRPELTRNTVFNWVPQGSKIELSSLDGSEDEIACSSVPFVHPMLAKLVWDQEPGILLYDVDDDVVGYVHFPLDRFSTDMMERFTRNFMMLVATLVRQPDRCVKSIPLL